VLHQIGVGALGPVFRTYEPSRDRLVAVKVFRLDVTPEQAQSLADELGRAATLGLVNPSIVEPVAAGVEGTVAYRAEEYVAAESLDVAMRHYAPATLDKVLPFITQLASAIDSARSAGVGHGALHPRDIFVTPEEARATGFGVVDALDRLGLRAPVRRPYSAPERIAGETWGTPADVFSLAAITFELLTGRRPSGPGDQMGPLTGALIERNLDEVRAVLSRAMQEDPTRRYATAMDFVSALDQAALRFETRAQVVPLATSATSEQTPTGPVPKAVEALADFPLEPVSPAPVISLEGESAREVARKVIAAREVRKRHIKPVAPLAAAASEPEPTPEPVPIPLPVPVPEPSAISLLHPPEPTRDEIGEIKLFEIKRDVVENEESTEETDEAITEDLPILTATPASSVDVSHEVPDIAAPAPEPAVPVDEFRPVEAVASIRRAEDRATLDRLMAPKPSIEPFDPELPPPIPLRPMPPPPRDEEPVPPPPAPERQRIVMLPLAVMLIIGLLLGYMAGYLVGTREQTTQMTAANTPPSSGLQTPGTSGQASAQAPAAKDFSEQAVAPPSTRAAQPSVTTPPPVPTEASRAPRPTQAATQPKPTAAQPAPAPTPKSTAKPAAAATARAGHIVVTSEPSRAAVTVNGKWVGRTPLTLADVAFGKYVIRVIEPGYEVAREEFSLTQSSPAKTISATLRPTAGAKRAPSPAATTGSRRDSVKPVANNQAAATGEIFVDSRPRGARVLIDGKEYGVTPTRVPAQTVGQHVVRLELADHAPWTKTESVAAGITARVTGSLERIR
jgi:serine/threonine protein kinase